jgi:hypothetical protein
MLPAAHAVRRLEIRDFISEVMICFQGKCSFMIKPTMVEKYWK